MSLGLELGCGGRLVSLGLELGCGGRPLGLLIIGGEWQNRLARHTGPLQKIIQVGVYSGLSNYFINSPTH